MGLLMPAETFVDRRRTAAVQRRFRTPTTYMLPSLKWQAGGSETAGVWQARWSFVRLQ
jgi:hypothetical protein